MYQFALIGCGAVAEQHVEQIQKNGSLAAVCDLEPSRADDFAARFNARAWYSIDELLAHEKDIDVVVVCTPNGCHAEHAIKSLQAGRHVLCESPLCLTGAAAWQMIETEKYCGRRLFVVHAAEGNGLLDEVRATVRQNNGEQLLNFELDCVAAPDADDHWRRQAFPGGQALQAYFSEAMDIVSYLFGPIEEASGSQSTDNSGIDDSGEVKVRTKKGMEGRISWKLEEGADYSCRLKLKSFEQVLWEEDTAKFTRGNDRYYSVYQQFLSEAGGNSNAPVSLMAATRTVEAIEKIYSSFSSTPAPSS